MLIKTKVKWKILIRMRETPGDPTFTQRWEEVGEVFKHPVSSERLAQINILVSTQDVTSEDLIAMPNLRYVCSPTTGHTHIKANLETRKIKLITLRRERLFLNDIRSVSEYTFFLILSLVRGSVSRQRVNRTLCGKTIGIIGMGRIGYHVAELAQGFKMKVKCLDITSTKQDWEDTFKGSHIISLHLPEEKSTHKIVSEEMIGFMKPFAYLINTARGSVLDEDAAIKALKCGEIAGLALDVVDKQEAISGVQSELGSGKLILSGHNAGNTLEDRIRTDRFIVEKLKNDIMENYQ